MKFNATIINKRENLMKEFTFTERDEFKRQPIAEKVINLLNSEVIVSPMVIDGAWGTGKQNSVINFLI